ncbi:MAG: HlyD family efflux transporter periplasmic adaptor subunit [Phycisphaeraceae bacterium]
MTTKAKTNNRLWITFALIGALVVVGLSVAVLRGGDGASAQTTGPTFEVKQGQLTISVFATGSLRSAQSMALKNDTQERTTIVYLIEEGTIVEEGDLLVELDSAGLQDDYLRQEIQFEQARSDYMQAESNLEVVKQQAKADVAAAEVAYELAELDLEKYQAPQGDYQQELREAQTNITLAESELERADDQLQGSVRLFEAGYITETELQADRLTYQRRKLDLELAKGQLNLLEQFSRRRRLAELNSSRDQEEFELTKVKHRTQSDIVDAETRLASRKLSFEREQDRLERMEEQIAACEVYAPVAGMVVHGTSGQGGRRQEPLAEGVEVHPRQDLIFLPTADSMIAEVKIHESMLQRVDRDLPVRLTTDALPGRVFEGRVKRIAVMPDAQNSWLNPDLKVYNAEVEVTSGASDLRSGMSCNAEIVVAELDDAKYVPIQSVMRVDRETMVYLPSANGPVAKQVDVGLDNNRMIQIVSGLERGDHVLLNPPLAPSRRPEDEGDEEGEELQEPEPELTPPPATEQADASQGGSGS